MQQIKINCRGKIIETTYDTLNNCKYFSDMFSELKVPKEIFLDCSAKGFRHILEFLKFPDSNLSYKYHYLCDWLLIPFFDIKSEQIAKKMKLGTNDCYLIKKIKKRISSRKGECTKHVSDDFCQSIDCKNCIIGRELIDCLNIIMSIKTIDECVKYRCLVNEAIHIFNEHDDHHHHHHHIFNEHDDDDDDDFLSKELDSFERSIISDRCEDLKSLMKLWMEHQKII